MKKQNNTEKILSLLLAGKKVSQKSVKFTNLNSLSSQISKFRTIKGMNIVCSNGVYQMVTKKKR
jgi:hypothetical protein